MLGKCFLLFWHFFFSFPFSLFVHLSVCLSVFLLFLFIGFALFLWCWDWNPELQAYQTPSPPSVYRHVCSPLRFKVNHMVLFPSQSSPSLWACHLFPWCQICSTHLHTCLFIMSEVPHTRSLNPKLCLSDIRWIEPLFTLQPGKRTGLPQGSASSFIATLR